MRIRVGGSASSSMDIDIIITYGTQLAVTILGILEMVVVARALRAEGQGAVQVAYMLASEAAQILSFGISISVVYIVARREFSKALIAGNAIWISILIGLPLTGALILLAPLLSRLLLADQQKGQIFIALAAPSGFLLLINSTLICLYRGSNQFRKFNFLTFINRVLLFLATILFLLILRGYVQSALLAVLIGNTVFGLFLLSSIWKDFGISLAPQFSIIRRLLTFNFAGHVATILQRISYRLDIFLIALFLPSTQVGLYGLAMLIGQLMWYLPKAIGIVLLSRTAISNRERANDRLILACQGLAIIISLAGFFAWILGPRLIPLIYGQDFEGSSSPFILLLPGIIALSFWKVLASDMTGRGKPIYNLYSACMGSIATVSLDLILIPLYSIKGAAVASSIAYSLTIAVMIVLSCRETQISTWELLIPSKKFFHMIFRRVKSVVRLSQINFLESKSS